MAEENEKHKRLIRQKKHSLSKSSGGGAFGKKQTTDSNISGAVNLHILTNTLRSNAQYQTPKSLRRKRASAPKARDAATFEQRMTINNLVDNAFGLFEQVHTA